MTCKLLINSHRYETRAALLENAIPVEFYIERHNDIGFVGNIYNGRVVRVLPGMQAAFVDIGLEKAAFLYVNEVIPSLPKAIDEELDEEDPLDSQNKGKERIEDLLQQGQDILVQVAKDPIGTKGARLTSNISLPGRYLVFMPLVEHVGVSKKIEKESERRRLRDFVVSNRPEATGFIVRTVCDGARVSKLKADIDYLSRLWDDIRKNREKTKAPALLHEELGLSLRLARDILSEEVDELVIDDERAYDEIIRFMNKFMPRQKKKITLYNDPSLTLFDRFGIEPEIERSLGRKVWLKSGGYITIDPTEALVSIDVNTGKYVGSANQEETIFKTNLEAVKEIAYQLRLRNIGGLIVIDFIDMPKEADRLLVYSSLVELLKTDRAKTKVVEFSELGLVQMSRKRVRESLKKVMSENCPYCHANGLIKSKKTITFAIFRQIEREFAMKSKKNQCVVYAHSTIIDYIYNEEKETIDHLESTYKIAVVFRPDESYHFEQYRVIAM